ncbi:hypothetical protein BC938DRAFT_476068 [Jimgerdemannia flammicorona]|uniref:Uncharacterized protein n=1 Tax=Jimgerdemannia flammicorona TaxID=994334 RepID=A0A433PKR5_9FUNG|nr:hypothetical protein BC938DRAFT_476068 [Jimgerdemannia flammicorona]
MQGAFGFFYLLSSLVNQGLRYTDKVIIQSVPFLVYLSRNGPNATTDLNPSNAVHFTITSPVAKRNKNKLCIFFGDTFRLVAKDGTFFQRGGVATSVDSAWFTGRFFGKFVANATQLVMVERGGAFGQFVPKKKPIGLSWGGAADGLAFNQDVSALNPDNSNRRLMTVRPNEVIILVDQWTAQESFLLIPV